MAAGGDNPGLGDLARLLPPQSRHRFIVAPPTGEQTPDQASSVAEVHPDSLDELDIFNDDWILVKGHKRRAAVLMVKAVETVPLRTICINDVQRKNLFLRNSDFCAIEGADPQPLRRVVVCPIEETVEGVDGNFLEVFLQPYFLATRRVLREGDLFMCRGAMKEAWFKVTELESGDGKNYGYVHTVEGGTELICGDKIPRDEGESELNAIGYEDIGGLRSQIQTIRETVELPLRHPRLFRTLGVRAPKGVLMHGPPGTGKTMIARAIANETGCDFITINGPEIMSGKQGGSEKNLRDIFQNAEEIASQPGNNGCIIFIDEIDAIAPNREKTQDEKLRRVVATLLTLMDGIKGGAHIMVIAATNRPNSLDPAIRRAGRFDTELIIPVPDRNARKEIFDIITRKMKLAEGVQTEQLADITHGYVGADIASACTKAAVNCIRSSARGLMDMEEEDIPAEFLDSLAVSMKDFYAALNRVTPSSMRDVVVEKPDVTFDDIGGLMEVKETMRTMVELPVKHPEHFQRLGIEPPSGALMFGPPGCGKTLIAKAMASECGVNFISIKGPQLLSKWFGEAEENVRDIFQKARQASPTILFFDELDSIAQSRGGYGASSAGGAGDRVVNQLLTELDGIGERKNVFVIGATNRPELIDGALRRPGRLDQLIYVPMPDVDARKGIFKACLRKTRVARNADIEKMAIECDGFSGSDIAGLCQLAVKISVREKLAAMQAAIEEFAQGDRKVAASKAALEVAKERTQDWAVSASAFERARNASKRSITEQALAGYLASKREIEKQTGGAAVGDGAAPAVTTGAFLVTQSATAGGAVEQEDDDDLYDE